MAAKAKTFSTRRYWITHFFIGALFIAIGCQLVQLSWIRRDALIELADKQHLLRVEIPPVRGQIADRKGKQLATNLKVPSVYAVPRLLSKNSRESLAEEVSRILGLPKEFVLERLSRDKAFVWLERRVTFPEAAAIRKLESPALGMLDEYKRFYPQGDLAANVIGFTDVDSRGLEGVELYANRDLQGRAGQRLTKRDALGREIKAFELRAVPAVDGGSVYLTLDQHIQYLTERALESAFLKWKAKGAWAVVMEAKTGRIVAMASRPNYDPNRLGEKPADARRNRAITDMFEPGSIFKIVTLSAALNENVVTPETVIHCENGEYRYSGSRTLHDVHPYGDLSAAEVLVKSSNIGTVKIAAKLAPEKFQEYIEAFGFGKPTGVDLPGEAPGFTRPPRQWSKTSPYNIPIGHEIMVTSLQMATAMAVVANGGTLVQPYMIERIEDAYGVLLHEKNPRVKKQVLRPEVTETMRHLLWRVVEEGTGKKARIGGIAVGGKTGTAQKILPDGKGYSHSDFVSSFVGFAPVEDPVLVMAVVIDDPEPLYYGGTVAAPVFAEVMEPALYSMGYVPKDARQFTRRLEEVDSRLHTATGENYRSFLLMKDSK